MRSDLRRRWHVWAALALPCLCFVGCSRPALASLLPRLELGMSAQRLRTGVSGDRERDGERWHALAFVSVRFTPRTAASQIPLRSEQSPETWILPCDADDSICLQEALEAEAELSRALGELQ